MDTLALAMKLVTFLGVLLAATGMNLPHTTPRALARDIALGAGGVGLMVANAWLAAAPIALALDVAYLAGCAVVLARAIRVHRSEVPTAA